MIQENNPKKAVVLLSGGLDSATCLADALEKEFEVYALSFNYGQRAEAELKYAKQVVDFYGEKVKQHIVINIDLRQWGGSALTSDVEVPEANSEEGIPITYVPARNTIFLSFAVGWAEVLGCRDIFIGVNSVDYSGYPDCRPQFIEAFRKCANLGTKADDEGWSFNIQAPLQFLKKEEIIKLGVKLGLDYRLTNSCYNPGKDGGACGKCDSCFLRKKGFADAELEDQTIYTKE
ncbi:7-cyano-7-deazaguanine synthase QueC [Lentisphaerota bacterium WC36G]|nr:7-cyano-7-deazaguanine synthase QueC [Lentisphaerae bacterium WC36]